MLHYKVFKIIVFTLVLIIFSLGKVSATWSTEGQLHSFLLQNYSNVARPVKSFDTVVALNYSAALYQLLGFDSKDESITTQFWQRMSWKDEFLSWDPAEWDDIRKLRFWQREIWVPDVLSFNEVADYDPVTFQYTIPIAVDFDGTVKWNLPVVLTTSCDMDVTKFPFDSQTCVINMGSWQYEATEVDIFCETSSFDTQFYSEHTLWDLKENRCERRASQSAVGSFSNVDFTLVFERRNTFYVLNILLPNAVLVALSSLIFFLPADGGERTGFGVTILLALCVNLMIVTDFVPETSKTIPDVTNYLLSSIWITTFSLLLAVISINLHFWLLKRAQKKSEMSRVSSYVAELPDDCPSEVEGPLKKMVVFDWALGTLYFIVTSLYSAIFIIYL